MAISMLLPPKSVNYSIQNPNSRNSARCFSYRQRNMRTNCLLKTQIEKTSPRVFVVSDLHTEYSDNMQWVRKLSQSSYRNDVLLVAGDVAETYRDFVLTMSELKDRFDTVFFVPGNHDLWCRREEGRFTDSLEKLTALLDACRNLGIETSPRTVNNLGIIPLYSWYHKSFDKEMDITGFRIPSLQLACKDFRACKWPSYLSQDDISLAYYFDQINENYINSTEQVLKLSDHIITFSHFVPRQELCPEKRMLFYPNLPKVIGSDFLETRIRSIHGKSGKSKSCHVFGHTHFRWDAVIDDIRYVQAPLAYPRERRRRIIGFGSEKSLPFCVYNEGSKDKKLPRSYWSLYYSKFKRRPENTKLAPWIARFYKHKV
ncbi:hypothetical protein LUZ60_014826 [Juncus effusus]|nr:hypothetical protein LUZ60_014826 [Juncus effusus]